MGYNVEYRLISHDGATTQELLSFCKENYGEELVDLFSFGYVSSSWISILDELSSLSKNFPTTVFAIHCMGDEFCDIWSVHFKNGLHSMDMAEIKFANFNEENLTEWL